jgi:predicted transcriptional regulator of viral defense system
MPDDRRVLVVERPKLADHPDRSLVELADRQYGVVARWQLVGLGLTPSMLKARVARGQLARLHRGVYAVGHRQLRREGHWVAAVLAAGQDAALSHRDAAALHGLQRPGSHRRIEVTTPRKAQSSERIRIYGRATLDAEDITSVHGIPVTTVARTLVDLAHTVSPTQLARAINEAERLGLFDLTSVERALERTAQRKGRGHAFMRKALQDARTTRIQLTNSELEARFLSLVVKSNLPQPTLNATIKGMQVDAVWREHKLAVELDGYAYHHTPAAFQTDRDRANDLARAGYTLLRFTYGDVVRRPGEVAARVAEMLRYAPAP